MDEPQPQSYHREFWKSPHHVVFGLVTLGVGFMTANVLGLIAGATAYSLGWIYLPDLGFFKRWVNRRHEAETQAEEARKIAEFAQRRNALLNSLASTGRERYQALARVCRDIEQAGTEGPFSTATAGPDPRLRKLDELMWTYLRLLTIEQSLRRFLETESDEGVPELLKDAEEEAARLTQEVEGLKTKGNTALLETRQRYLSSRLERVDVLRKRKQRNEQAQSSLALVSSEQERLEDQIKLIRAESIAAKNADALSARIDATVEHLDQTNRWLSEMAEFKDLGGDMPLTDSRLGYDMQPAPMTPASPPVIETLPRAPRGRVRQYGQRE